MDRNLLRWGLVLFFLGVMTGFAVPVVESPRMGLSAHLGGTANGVFLILMGVIWSQFNLGATAKKIAAGILIYGTYVNWASVLLGAIWGTGRSTPIAGAGFEGTDWQEAVVLFGLASLSIVLPVGIAMLLWGLRGKAKEEVGLEASPAQAAAGK